MRVQGGGVRRQNVVARGCGAFLPLSLLALGLTAGSIPAVAQDLQPPQRHAFLFPDWHRPPPPPEPMIQRDPRLLPPPASRAAPRRPQTSAPKASFRPLQLPVPKGPHLLIVSVKSQRATLYADGKFIVSTPVSTGKATNPTPHGVFSIIQRNRHHRSNIYSNAPMPYMQRLTWSGIALHEGALPGYPASHGCIRLPEPFADFLWRTTRLGARVVIASDDVEPVDISHPLLFQPREEPATVEAPLPLRKTFDTTGQHVQMAQLDGTSGQGVADTTASAAEGSTGSATADTTGSTNEVAADDLTVGSLPQDADIPAEILASYVRVLDAKRKRVEPRGPISVFVSRKDKRLYVRQNFIPLFSAPVVVKGDAAFGTHVFTALQSEPGVKTLRWSGVTLPSELPKPKAVKAIARTDNRGRRIEMKAPRPSQVNLPEPEPAPDAASVLDRIEIAPEVVEHIASYIGAGASLIVADQGLGHETGLHTDFIVVTR